MTIRQTAEVKHFETNLVQRAVVKKKEEEAFSPRGQPPSEGRMHSQREAAIENFSWNLRNLSAVAAGRKPARI